MSDTIRISCYRGIHYSREKAGIYDQSATVERSSSGHPTLDIALSRGMTPVEARKAAHIRFDYHGEGFRIVLSPARGGKNLYRNEVIARPPSFLIRKEDLFDRTTYYVKDESNQDGDFLILRGRTPNPKGRDYHTIVINLWAVFAFAGIESVDSHGVLSYGGKPVYVIRPMKDGVYLPFCLNQHVPWNQQLAIGGAIMDFKQKSHEVMNHLLRPDPEYRHRPIIDRFDRIAKSVSSPHPRTRAEQVLRTWGEIQVALNAAFKEDAAVAA